MKRTWLRALVPIALAYPSLLVSAATEQGCFSQPVLASDAGVRFRGEFVGGATVPGCDSSDSSKQVCQVAFDRTNHCVAVLSFPFAPEPSNSDLLGLASLAFQLGKEVSDAKPLIRGRPP